MQQFFVQESVITHILFVQKSVVAHKLYVWKNVKKKDRRHAYPMEKYAESQAFGEWSSFMRPIAMRIKKLSTLLREIAPSAEQVFRDQYVMEFIGGKDYRPEPESV